MSDEEIRDILQKLVVAIADLDATMIEELIRILVEASDQEPMCAWSRQMKNSAEEYDFERCEKLANQWLDYMLGS